MFICYTVRVLASEKGWTPISDSTLLELKPPLFFHDLDSIGFTLCSCLWHIISIHSAYQHSLLYTVFSLSVEWSGQLGLRMWLFRIDPVMWSSGVLYFTGLSGYPGYPFFLCTGWILYYSVCFDSVKKAWDACCKGSVTAIDGALKVFCEFWRGPYSYVHIPVMSTKPERHWHSESSCLSQHLYTCESRVLLILDLFHSTIVSECPRPCSRNGWTSPKQDWFIRLRPFGSCSARQRPASVAPEIYPWAQLLLHISQWHPDGWS